MVPPSELPAEERLEAGDLIAELLAITADTGPNESAWPSLTTYRFTSPQALGWSGTSLSVCGVVQGCMRAAVDGTEHRYGPFTYVVLTDDTRFGAEILEASPEKPFLSFVLQIDPAVVRGVWAEMGESEPADPPTSVSAVDQDLIGAVLRFLRALGTGPDRRVLAPAYLREITYRLLRAGQRARLLLAAATEQQDNPVSDVIRYAGERIAEPLTVADMAQVARMSPSALTSVFTEVTGMGPYQFLKRMRLDRAGALLARENINVNEVARLVGYTSVSHFIDEFKRYFGTTPRTYAAARRRTAAMRDDTATNQEGPQ